MAQTSHRRVILDMDSSESPVYGEMETRTLGDGGPDVPVICLGALSFGGGMGSCPDEQAIRTVHACLDAGVTFIDTAEAYLTSEAVVGKALRGRRQEVFLATKLSGEHTSKHIAEAMENSLRALGTDYIDLYQIHNPRPERPIGETIADLLKLRDDGKFRYLGVSNHSAQQHIEAAQYGPVLSSQFQYHMLNRKAEEEVLPTCLENGAGVIVHSPLARGLLTGKYPPGHQFSTNDWRSGYTMFTPSQFEAAYPYVEKLSAWANDHGRDIAQLAIAWTLAHPAVTSSIVGAKSPEQALHNVSAADWTLTKSELAELDGILVGAYFDAR